MVTDELAPVIPVVLSDRPGTRLWPSSVERRPEQFLPLPTGLSPFQETVCRAQFATPEAPVVVCDVEHRALVEDQLGRLSVTPAAIVCQPGARSAASAVAAAALAIGEDQPGALLLVLPCDHPVGDVARVIENLAAATLAAAAGYLVAFGLASSCPEAEVRHVRGGPALAGRGGLRAVDPLLGTPEPDRSHGFDQGGARPRPSGTFLVSRRVVLAELSTRESPPAASAGLEAGDSGAALTDLERVTVVRVLELVRELRSPGRSEAEGSAAVPRPWGSYRSVDVGPRHQVKRIIVEPGQRLSLQRHRQRAEHWVVVQGTASIVCGTESRVLQENESAFIPVGCAHRLENPGSTPLHLVEVQVGDYLGEDDIERLADDYGRT
jgi:mannose-1-phosphate guanylyltransferase/mannose-6-phosphate isomerase-like protein (cupin superfamily)